MSKPWQILRVALPAGAWTAIITPVPCNFWSVKSASGNVLGVASDPTDAAQQDTLPVNAQEVLLASYSPALGQIRATESGVVAFFRYLPGDILLYAKPTGSGDDTAVLRLVL